MQEAAAHARTEGEAARLHTMEVPDVRKTREALGLSTQPKRKERETKA